MFHAVATAIAASPAPWWGKIVVGFALTATGFGFARWIKREKIDDVLLTYAAYVVVATGLAVTLWGLIGGEF